VSALEQWPGLRRAGRSTAEPGAEAGPAAARSADALDLYMTQFGNAARASAVLRRL